MTIDLDELERLAKAANGIAGGDWTYKADSEDCGHVRHERVYGPRCYIGAAINGDYFTNDMKHIAAANPETVLALVQRVRELEKAYQEECARTSLAEDLLRDALESDLGWEDTEWGPKAAKIVGAP